MQTVQKIAAAQAGPLIEAVTQMKTLQNVRKTLNVMAEVQMAYVRSVQLALIHA